MLSLIDVLVSILILTIIATAFLHGEINQLKQIEKVRIGNINDLDEPLCNKTEVPKVLLCKINERIWYVVN